MAVANRVAMKERGILFSAPMIGALLSGSKTQTRRVVKPQPNAHFTFMPLSTELVGLGNPDKGWQCCPHGGPGDKLWCREAWQSAAAMNVCHKSDDYIIYRATDPDWETQDGWRWRPSIFMPRWASRITLEIEQVRVERLQEISAEDCLAEGIDRDYLRRDVAFLQSLYRRLWDSINRKRFPWASNPWVFAITFRKL